MQTREHGIGAGTTLVGLFGHPVGHTLSPRMHNAAFALQGLDYVYLAFDVLPEALPFALTGMRALGMRGVNLTVPHKEAVLPLLDRVDPLAGRVGAVNTIVNDGGELVGYNTDVPGFADALRTVLPAGAAGLTCVVAGAGGAARAVVAALVEDGAAEILVHNRSSERAAALCAAAASWGGSVCRPLQTAELSGALRRARLVVNATSLGLEGAVKKLSIPVDTLGSGHVVVDVVYGRAQTELVDIALNRGAVAIDGREMLVRQAVLAYRLWTGVQPPADVMRDSMGSG